MKAALVIVFVLALANPAYCKKKGKGSKDEPHPTEITPPQPSESNAPTSPSDGGATSQPSPPLPSGNLTTLSGKTFEAAALKRVDPDGLLIVHKGGVAKVLFTDLPQELRERYGYDAQKAVAFQDAQKAEQAVQAQRQAKEHAAETAMQAKAEAAAAAEKEVAKKTVWIQGKIIQIVKGGMIIDPLGWVGRSNPKGRPPAFTDDSKPIFLVGHKRQDQKVDGDKINVDAYADGVFSYTSTSGAERRLRKYQVTKTIR